MKYSIQKQRWRNEDTPCARTELYINQSFNTHKHTLLLLSSARGVRKLKNNNAELEKRSKALWTIHALSERQSFYALTFSFFTGKHTRRFKPHPHPAFFSLTHTLTTTRQSHYIKQKPVTAHISVRLGSVRTHS